MKKLLLVLFVTLFVSVLLADPMDEINDWAAKQTGNFDANDVVTFMNGRAEGDITYSSEYVYNSAYTTYISVAVLDATHFVVSYRDDGNSSYGTAVIGTVSGSSISYGSEYVFNSALIYYTSVAVLDATHFVVSYRDDGNSGYGTAVIGTVSDNTISYGSEYGFNSAYTNYLSIAVLDATHFVVSYRDDGNSGYGTAVIGTVSDNTISYGSEYVFNSAVTTYLSVAVLDAAHFVVSYHDYGNSYYGTAVIGTVSDNTISYGSEYVFNSAETNYLSVAVLDATHFIVSYCDYGNSYYGTAIVGEVEPFPPIINSITDIQNDQGHQVQLIWTRAYADSVYSQNNFYTVWRLDEQPERKTGSIIVEDISDILLYTQNRENTKLYWQRDEEIWTYIATIPSLLFEQYSLIAPTLIDSSASSTPEEYNSTFMVAFHGEDNYYLSETASGYSVDNIAPDETRVYIAQNGSSIGLSWDEVEYGTFQGNSYPEINGIWYKIYAGDSPDFVCDEAHLIDTVTDLYYDYPLAGEEKKFFKIVVSDQPE